jgi:Tol biopolymer transport system component
VAFVRGPRDPDEDVFRDKRHVIGSIYVMNADGSGVRRLTHGHDDHAPTWSPDGRKIAFERNGVLYVRNLSGSSRLRRLTAIPDDSRAPAWSPDGRRIAFEYWYDEDDAYSIAIIPARGGRITRVTDADTEDTAPSWSPDGREIVFARDTGRGQQLYVVSVGSHRLTPLTAPRPCVDCWSLTDALAPTWSPDGGAIAFARTQQVASSLNVVTRDGRREWRLTDTPASDLWPDWQAVRR